MKASQSTKSHAFTLIELLIVVAIIAILAAIAVPNFLAAQVRSKVTRAKADLRTLATAIEAYSSDHNRPPYDGEPDYAHYGWVNSYVMLTTPVAYMTTLPVDPFQDDGMPETLRAGHMNYLGGFRRNHSFDYSTQYWENTANNPDRAADWQRAFGNSAWKSTSAGPDLAFMNEGSFFGFREVYDATNGTISAGDIVRTAAKVE